MPLWTVVNPDLSEASDDVFAPASYPSTSSRQKQCLDAPLGPSPKPHTWRLLLPFYEPEDANKNTAWFSSPGVWSTYVLILLMTWLFVQAAAGFDPMTALVVVNATHFVVGAFRNAQGPSLPSYRRWFRNTGLAFFCSLLV